MLFFCCVPFIFVGPFPFPLSPLPQLFPLSLSQAVTRTRLLDYFTARRRATRDDHVLFAFEQGMALGPNEQTFLTQLCLQVLMKQQTVLSRIFFPLWTRGFSLFVSSNSHFA